MQRSIGVLEHCWTAVGALEHWSRGAATGRHGRIEASSRCKVWRHGGAIEEWRL